VSHDLNEAMKLGNHIILMKDGRIIQHGTSEEILTNPASDYVESFIEDVDKSKVLSADSAMSKVQTVAYENDGPRTALRRMRTENLSVIFVVNKKHQLIGSISIDDIEKIESERGTSINSVINRDIYKASLSDPLHELMEPLTKDKYIPVVNEHNVLKGLVSKSGLLSALTMGE